MNRLFVELYLDEDVDVLVDELLQVRGFVATTARAEGRLHDEDAEQLAFAVSRHKALLTHNRSDFETLAAEYFATGREHYGVVLAVHRPPYEIVRRLPVIFNDVTADEMQNQVIYI